MLNSTSNSLKHFVAARCAGLASSSSLLLPRGLSLPRLRVVDLTSCGLAAFDARAAPKLAALILTGNPGVEISNLNGCKELATLVVKGCELSDDALSLALRGCTSLSKLSAANNRLRGGAQLDLTALKGALSELRLGHNDLRALPRGLSPRLRVLDAGANAKLGPLRSVVGELSKIALGGGSSWLRAVTLRGTAAALEGGYERAVAAAAPALRVLDDKRVSREKEEGRLPAATVEQGARVEGEEEEELRHERRRKEKKKRSSAIAVGELADETGLSLSLPPPPLLPKVGKQLKSSVEELPLPPPPPPPATPGAEAAARKKSEKIGGGGGAKVIEVQQQKRAKKGSGNENGAGGGGGGGVATGKEAARLLAAAAGGGDTLEEVGGW